MLLTLECHLRADCRHSERRFSGRRGALSKHSFIFKSCFYVSKVLNHAEGIANLVKNLNYRLFIFCLRLLFIF